MTASRAGGRRLIVTRVDDAGHATHDEEIVEAVVQAVDPRSPLMQAGKTYTSLWGTGSAVPTVGVGGNEPALRAPFFAGPGETRFVIFTAPPQDPALAELHGPEGAVPGLEAVFQADGSGMHATDTVDYVVVLSGAICLELDDGVTVTLKQGECLVQRGTRHAWRNPFDQPAVLAAFMVGAVRVSTNSAAATKERRS